jgi:hypothetical protein
MALNLKPSSRWNNYNGRSDLMIIVRHEDIVVTADKGEKPTEIAEAFDKLQDIQVMEFERMGEIGDSPIYLFKVQRRLELYPDTIK